MSTHVDAWSALADPTRRSVVEALRSGERPVNEIVARLGIHQSGVFRHLRILNQAGFARVRAAGSQRPYSLRPEPFRELDAWVSGYRGLWQARLDRFAEALAKKQRARARRRKETKS
jgi:DNA-binding transcriptional ArsR family regulator